MISVGEPGGDRPDETRSIGKRRLPQIAIVKAVGSQLDDDRGRPNVGPGAANDESCLLRLALWLADVAAEAAAPAERVP